MAEREVAKSSDLDQRLNELQRSIRGRRVLRALIGFGGVSVGAVLLCTLWFFLRGPRPSDWLIGVLAFGLIELISFGVLVLRVWRSTPTRAQIALYVDEHFPELENLVISAEEFGRVGTTKASAWLVERLLTDPRLSQDRLPLGDLIAGGIGVRLALTALLILALLGGWVAGFHNLWIEPARRGAAGGAHQRNSLVVEPGNARVRPGQNQLIIARTADGDVVAKLKWRTAGGWREIEMTPGKTPRIFYHQFTNVASSLEYKVEWNGQISPSYRLTLWEPPEVERVDLTYRYPDYLELPDRVVPGGGNIFGVEGTQVDFRVAVNKPLKEAKLVFDSGAEVKLGKEMETSWAGNLTLSKDDRYHVELVDEGDEENLVTNNYSVKVKPDLPPKVQIKFPRGDSEATSLDEIPFEFKVEDDYGVADYGLQYEVSGKPPVRVSLATGKVGAEAMGEHTLALENLGLKAGDLITWSAWASDRRPGRKEFEGYGDPYFLPIRPFVQRYREAQSSAGAQAQGGGSDAGIDELQKQVIVATWNLRSRAPGLSSADYDRDRASILEAEIGIQHRVEEASRMARGTPLGTQLNELLKELVQSIRSLELAKGAQAIARLTEAEQHERAAYQILLEGKDGVMEVALVKGMSAAERMRNPADIEELEMERNKNFYEEESRPTHDDPKINEALKRLEELAARQALINEEIAKLISELKQARTDQEREEIRRRLEKLKEEIQRNLEQLDNVERGLQDSTMSPDELKKATEKIDEARRQNSQSLESLDRQSADEASETTQLQEARSSARRALEAVTGLQSELKGRSRDSVEDRLNRLADEFGEFQTQEKRILERIGEIRRESEGPGLRTPDTGDEATSLSAASRKLSADFVRMMDSAGKLAEAAQEGQPLVSRKLGDWLRETSGKGIAEDLNAAENAVRYSIWDKAEENQNEAGRKIAGAAEKLDSLRGMLVGDDDESLQLALDRLYALMKKAGLDPGEGKGGKEMADAGGPGESGSSSEQRNQERSKNTHGEDGRGGSSERLKPGEKGMTPGREADETGWLPDNRDGDGRGPADEKEQGQGSAFSEDSDKREGAGGRRNPADDQAARFGKGEDESAEASGSGDRPKDGSALNGKASTGERGGNGESQDSSSKAGKPGDSSGKIGEVSDTEGESSTGEGGADLGKARRRGLPRTDEKDMAGESGGEGGHDISSRQAGSGAGARSLVPPQDWTFNPEKFLTSDFRDWVNQLRDAQTVLGEGDPVTTQLDLIALQIERMRREYARKRQPPRFDLFLEGVVRPLQDAAARLEGRLNRSRWDNDLKLLEAEEVPSQYQQLVSDYFESLSAHEGPAKR